MDPFIPSQQPRSAYNFISGLDAVDCSICTEPFGTHHPPVVVPGCRHIFGLECLAEWVFSTNLSHNRCPICRRLMFDNGVSEADGGIYNHAIYPALGEPPVYILNRSYIEGLWTGATSAFWRSAWNMGRFSYSRYAQRTTLLARSIGYGDRSHWTPARSAATTRKRPTRKTTRATSVLWTTGTITINPTTSRPFSSHRITALDTT